MLPAGAVAGRGLHPLESAALSRRTSKPVIRLGASIRLRATVLLPTSALVAVTSRGLLGNCRELFQAQAASSRTDLVGDRRFYLDAGRAGKGYGCPPLATGAASNTDRPFTDIGTGLRNM